MIDGKSVARLRDKRLLYRNPKKALMDCMSVAVACGTWDRSFLVIFIITRDLKTCCQKQQRRQNLGRADIF